MRDGFQNEPVVIPTEQKLEHLQGLLRAGFRDIEVTAFVRPSWVPPLADAAQVVAALPDAPGVRFWALVPNAVGLNRALDSGLRHVATFLSASEAHNKKNVNRTVTESLSELQQVIAKARAEGVQVRAYLSTVFGCPFEGDVPIERSVVIARALLDAGAQEIALSDTIGSGNPVQVKHVVEAMLAAGIGVEQLAMHLHDTRGTALANAYSAWQEGVRTFDGCIAGIGGCPYAPGAAGNAASEDLVNMFELMGVDTGVNLGAACEVAETVTEVIGKPLPGRYHKYLLAARRRSANRSA